MTSISLKNIESIVPSDILQKAQQIILNSAVESIEQYRLHDYTAIVSGSHRYIVNIVLDKNLDLYTHRCSCPYVATPFCKHKVAVILSIKEVMSKNEKIPEGSLAQIDSQLITYNKEQLHQLIIELCKQSIEGRSVISKMV